MMKTLNVLSVLCVFSLSGYVFAHKILFLAPVNGKSHWNYLKVFIEELVNRGHEVTCITSISMGENKLDNYTEILIDPAFFMGTIINDEELFKTRKSTQFESLKIFTDFGSSSCAHFLNDKKVQEIIHRNDLHFDLVIHEEVYHDALLMFAHKFGAPLVTICPYGIPEFFDHDLGLLTPLSHVSHTLLTFTDNMNFSERWYNFIFTMCDLIIRHFIHIPRQMELIETHFGHLAPLPSFKELRQNISIIFVNAHRSITHPRPAMPGLIQIGGAHIKPPKPLPVDLQKFLDEAEHGVIYFSFGSIVKSSKMPTSKLNAFLEIFRKLKQRVIWKFEDDSIENMPKNILIKKWLPQTAILAHPNVVLFISHGGMFSNFEAIKYGVQMLMIPFAVDQFRNALRVESAGYGKHLSFDEITIESLDRVLGEMLTSDKYMNRAKEVAAICGDNVAHPMDEFIWWIDHVIKFRGAKYLKSHSTEMSSITYLSLDVILLNLIIISAVIYSIYYLTCRVCFKSKNSSSKDKRD